MVLLPKMYNLILIVKKHQTNQLEPFYRITCPWNLYKCQGQEKQRKTLELFQIERDLRDMTIKCNVPL